MVASSANQTTRFVVAALSPGPEPSATLAAAVRSALPGIAWSRARDLCVSGRVRVDGDVELDPARRLPAGSVVEIDPGARRRRAGTLSREAVVHVDAEVVVVRKPAGLMTVPFEHGDRDTLIDMTRAALRRMDPRAHRGVRGVRYDPRLAIVHRLDKDTTGLVVFARTLAAKRHLDQQFRRHTVTRRYLAIANGKVEAATFDTVFVPNRGDGLRGSWGRFGSARGLPPSEGRHAVTHVRPVEQLRGATLLECRLETGRQHQIRIHLSEAGHPLVGERVYIRHFGRPLVAAPRPMLHATELGFVHPRTEQPLRFEDPPPEDFVEMLRKLG